MPYLILGVALLLAALLAARWYVSAPPSTLVKALKWAAAILVVLVVGVLLLTKNVIWALFALPALLPWFLRLRSAATMSKNWSCMAGATAGGGAGAAPGGTSEIETRYMRMFLDHSSGEMNGDVVLGKYNGSTLRSLSEDQLLELLGECASDEQSVQVLTAYLDRYHGDEWRQKAEHGGAGGNGATSGSGSMTREEALAVLGLEDGASEEDIKSAHHKLMSKIHPDHGGSTYLATKINQAKDYLLGA